MSIIVPVEGRPSESLSAFDVLVDTDGNAFGVIATTKKALNKAGASKEYIDSYMKEAMSGDYDHLLTASIAYLSAE